jgi:hypothetical protein
MATQVSCGHLDALFQSATGAEEESEDHQNLNGSEKMWTKYMGEAEKYDEQISEDWREDSNGILVFVRLSSTFPAVHRNDCRKDRSSLYNCRRIHH